MGYDDGGSIRKGPPSRAARDGGSIGCGAIIAVVVLAAAPMVGAFVPYDTETFGPMWIGLLLVPPVVLFLVGAVLAFVPRARGTGLGMLIAAVGALLLAAGVLVLFFRSLI
ncbi:MAG: hypothetical protein QM619_03220 [Micropruina sp.]|uniref:hypothetical protein n=1 Tax=Micropruina sp. TaxID=2737536 RepID=UPI0039E69FFF